MSNSSQLEANKRYLKTTAGRASAAKYCNSAKGKKARYEANKRYIQKKWLKVVFGVNSPYRL